MKRTILKTSLISLIALALLSGCGKDKPKPTQPNFGCTQNGVPAPSWTCDPYLKGSVVALGIAQPNAGNDLSMQRAEAVAEGRDALISQLSIKVDTLFKSYKGITGSGSAKTFDKSTSKVSKQLASKTLNNSRAIKTWKDATGTMYVLVGVDTNTVKNAMEDSVKTSFKNDKAMYQKFLASKAQNNLNKELEKINK